MAKNKKMRRQLNQLPYAQRIQIRRRCEIAAEREAAATRMLMGILCALHRNEKMGFVRLNRFGEHVMELIMEFYGDRELNEDRLRRRLATLGIELERYAVPPPSSMRLDDVLQSESQDAAMVAMLVSLVAANDVAGLGADRLSRLSEKTSDVLRDMAEHPEKIPEYEAALQKIGFIVRDGKMYKYQTEDGRPVKAKEAEA